MADYDEREWRAEVIDTLKLWNWDVSTDDDFWRRYHTEPWLYAVTAALVITTAALVRGMDDPATLPRTFPPSSMLPERPA